VRFKWQGIVANWVVRTDCQKTLPFATIKTTARTAFSGMDDVPVCDRTEENLRHGLSGKLHIWQRMLEKPDI